MDLAEVSWGSDQNSSTMLSPRGCVVMGNLKETQKLWLGKALVFPQKSWKSWLGSVDLVSVDL